MKRKFTVKKDNQRVDRYLAEELPEFSRSTWKRAIDNQSVTVNGNSVSAHDKVSVGDELAITIPDADTAEQEQPPILYEDEFVVVFNKPAGTLTHSKGADNNEFTLADAARAYTTDEVPDRPGIVHRLDRGTSGVIVVARTPEAKTFLQKQFADRKVLKQYTAIVGGKAADQEAIFDWPVERNPRKPQMFRVGANGKPAQTHMKVLKQGEAKASLLLEPRTGRTHQIRVHLKHYGTPIVGDDLYGGEPADRLYLHAYVLQFSTPDGKQHTISAPTPWDEEQMVH